MKLLSLVFLTFFYINVQAQSLNKIVEGDIFTGIRYDKNFVVNPEAERSHTVGVSSTMSTTSRTALAANVISGQLSYELTAGAASQTFTLSSTPLPAGLNGQTCEGSFSYRFGSLTIPFVASVLSGTTEVASSTLTNSTGSTSATVRHVMTYPCITGVSPSVRITSSASSAIKLYADKHYTGLYLNLTASGSGSGGTSLPTGELITSGTAEFGNPFVGFTTAATAKPTTSGTAGATSLTAVVSSTAPLDGANSFIISKASGDALGQQVRIPFSVPDAGFARAHTISMDYRNLSGLFQAGSISNNVISNSSLIPYILDHSTNTYIEPSSYLFTASSTTITDHFQASFQTSATGASYSLVLHQASSGTEPYSFKVDNISVSPNKYVFGTPFSDEQSYTPTITGFGTVTGVEFYYTRSGDKTLIRGRFVAGTPTAVEGQVSLPNGQVSKAGTNNIIVGYGARSTTSSQHFAIISKPSVNYLNFGGNNGGTAGTAPANGNAVAGAGETISFFAEVTIAGQSSSVQMSDQTSTRVIAAKQRLNGNTAVAAAAVIPFSSFVHDTHSGFSGGRYTIPVAGIYKISLTGFVTATGGADAVLYKNGVAFELIMSFNNTLYYSGSSTLQFVAGDVIDIRPSVAITVGSAAGFSVELISGPNQIAASELVAASFYSSANQAVTANATKINFDTKSFDTHNAVTTGTEWKFTAPIAGTYQIAATFGTSSANANWYFLKYTAAGVSLPLQSGYFGYTTPGVVGSGSKLVKLAAGEYIQVLGDGGVTLNAATSPTLTTHISITRIGL